MADTILSYTIPEAKVDDYVDYFVYVHKNNEKDEEGELIYTDKQWVREHILRYIRSQIKRGKSAKDRDELSVLDTTDVT